ncbi:hypothetical protein [Brevifollis gellanilyticus]|nr:hypothetical protein [Brevifollis gellanilyticus]
MIPHPKSTLAWLTMLALASGASLRAQDNMMPVSRTTGTMTVSLPKGKPTLLAIPFADIVAAGEIDSVNGTVYEVTSSPAAMPNVIATPHALKITTRVDQRGAGTNAPAGTSLNAYGLTARITAQVGQEITAALSTAPNPDDRFVVYKLQTLGSLFGAANTAGLKGSTDAATADIVYLNADGNFTGYFYSTTANGWRLVSAPAGADQAGTVIPPRSALLVVRQADGNDTSVRVAGATMPARETWAISSGYRLINNPFSVATTLEASGLRSHVAGGTSAAAADLLYLEDAGVITAYWYKTGGLGGSGWRELGDNVTNKGGTLLSPGKSILFKEQAGSTAFALPEPFED